MVCSRRSSDPLLRLFLDVYRVNLLEMPRGQVDLGSVFVVRGAAVDNIPMGDILDGQIDVMRETDEPEAIETVTKKSSGSLDMSASANLVGRILAAIGLPGDEPSIKGALQGKGGHEAAVTMGGLKVERIRRDKLAMGLRDRVVRAEHPFSDGDLYVCTGTWAARSLEMSVTSDKGGHVEAEAALKLLVEANGKLSVTRGNLAETVFKSAVPLVFGVELMKLKPTLGGIVLDDYRPDRQMRGPSDAGSAELAMVEVDPESAFLPLAG